MLVYDKCNYGMKFQTSFLHDHVSEKTDKNPTLVLFNLTDIWISFDIQRLVGMRNLWINTSLLCTRLPTKIYPIFWFYFCVIFHSSVKYPWNVQWNRSFRTPGSSAVERYSSSEHQECILNSWFNLSKSLASQTWYRSVRPISDRVIRSVLQMLVDMTDCGSFMPCPCRCKFSDVRKCSTASLQTNIASI